MSETLLLYSNHTLIDDFGFCSFFAHMYEWLSGNHCVNGMTIWRATDAHDLGLFLGEYVREKSVLLKTDVYKNTCHLVTPITISNKSVSILKSLRLLLLRFSFFLLELHGVDISAILLLLKCSCRHLHKFWTFKK